MTERAQAATLSDQANLLTRLDRLPITWTAATIIAILMLTWLAEAFDIGSIGSIILLLKKTTWHLTKSQLGLLGAAGTIGIVIGLPFAGRLADYYGRKRLLIIGVIIFSIFTLVAALSSNVRELIVFRFIAGLGEGAVFAMPYLFLTELVNKKRRGVVIGWSQILLGVAYALTSFAGAWAARDFSPDSGWRVICILGGIPLVLLPIIWWWLPESPRILLKWGRVEEVRRLVERLERDAGLTHDTSIVDEGALRVLQATEGRKARVGMLLQSPYLMRAFVSYAALTSSFVGFYLAIVFGPVLLHQMGIGVQHAFIFFGASTLVAAAFAPINGAVSDRFGRRLIHSIWMVVCAGSFLVFGQSALPVVVLIVAGLLLRITTASSFTSGKTYMAEQFATQIRGLGVGVGECLSRFLGGVVFVYFIPFLKSGVGLTGVFEITAGLTILLILPLVFLGKESAGVNVETYGTEISALPADTEPQPARVRV